MSYLDTTNPDFFKRQRKKLVIVGDGACGKTSLLMVQSGQEFPTEYVPTIFENFITQIHAAKNKVYEMSLWDTAGQEEYDRLRPLSYPDTDVVLLCFSLIHREGFENIRDKWYPETNHFLHDVPRILVGNQKDLRDNATDEERAAFARRFGWPEMQRPITYEEGVKLAHEIGSAKYFETSAKTKEGVYELFVAGYFNAAPSLKVE
ncbi:hypothetical protein SpCBS45565_g02152 [Spizellomyces sp. 'palustris']|nr:hypothetical protein SpCBS45565_g02152 [Spizellomyces sp. 'palustris']